MTRRRVPPTTAQSAGAERRAGAGLAEGPVEGREQGHDAAREHDVEGDDEQVAGGARGVIALVRRGDGHGDEGEGNGDDARDHEELRVVELDEVAHDVVGEHGAQREDGSVGGGHGRGDDAEEAPGAEERGGLGGEQLDESLGVGLPRRARGQVEDRGAGISLEIGVFGVGAVVVPGDGAEVREGDADEEGEQAAEDAADACLKRGPGRHAPRLEVESGEVDEAEHEDCGPVE